MSVGRKAAGAVVLSALMLAAGCAADRRAAGTAGAGWAAERGFAVSELATPPFRLFAAIRQRRAAAGLVVYIEGDGAPWPSPFRPPRDPTPLTPLALLLAERDPSPGVAYLARPCQYLADDVRQHCASAYWSERRFAPEVLAAMDAALDALKRASGAGHLTLVGHSGGGVVATLLAGRRSDVRGLLTVASPLSLDDWLGRNGLTPLADAVDPVERPLPPRLAAVHVAAAGDDVVPVSVIAGFVARRGGRLVVVDGADHDCCWVRDWPELLVRAGVPEDGR